VDECSAYCGEGVQTQRRIVLTPAQYGGIDCPALTRTVSCFERPCVNCTGGQVFEQCGRPCVPKCEDPNPPCTGGCLSPRCQCPNGYVLFNNTCIRYSQCPTPGLFANSHLLVLYLIDDKRGLKHLKIELSDVLFAMSWVACFVHLLTHMTAFQCVDFVFA
jgi:hypothetical protein